MYRVSLSSILAIDHDRKAIMAQCNFAKLPDPPRGTIGFSEVRIR